MAVKAQTRGFPELYDVGSGFALAWYPEVLDVDADELDVVVTLQLSVESGKLVIDRFDARRRADGPPITIDVLKSIPVRGLIALGASEGFDGLVRVEPDGSTTAADVPGDLEKLPALDSAAVIYRWAYFVGEPPTATVAEMLGLTRDVAAKRVQAARRAGLLEPTSKGRKGA